MCSTGCDVVQLGLFDKKNSPTKKKRKRKKTHGVLVDVVCECCGKVFKRGRGQVNSAEKNGWKHYCSRECSGKKRPLFVSETEKQCNVCNEIKPLEKFPANKTCAGGRVGRCHACRNAHNAVRRNSGPTSEEKSSAFVEKKCSKCGDIKPIEMFHPDNNSATGKSSWCRACANGSRRRVLVPCFWCGTEISKRHDPKKSETGRYFCNRTCARRYCCSKRAKTRQRVEKCCSKCSRVLPLTKFSKQKSSPDGRSCFCRECKRRDYHNRYFYHAAQRHNTTVEILEEMQSSQENCCAICGTHADLVAKGKLFVDHCHASGEVRGLLCHQCNIGIGCLSDDVPRMVVAIEYVRTRGFKIANSPSGTRQGVRYVHEA